MWISSLRTSEPFLLKIRFWGWKSMKAWLHRYGGWEKRILTTEGQKSSKLEGEGAVGAALSANIRVIRGSTLFLCIHHRFMAVILYDQAD